MTLTHKRLFAMTTLATAISMLGCTPHEEVKSKQIGMANPAAEYCVKLGGKVVIQTDAAGNQAGICHLPDGTTIDEWALFRRDHAKPGQ